MVAGSVSDVLCDKGEEEARNGVIQRLDAYRQRISQAANTPSQREVYDTIAQELSTHHVSLGACAAALLNSRIGPSSGTKAWTTLVSLRDSIWEQPNRATAESAINLRLLGQVAAHWGARVLQHYAWTVRGRSFLERLWGVAEQYPDWATAARYLNVVLVLRHELVLMGRSSGGMRSWQTIGHETARGMSRLPLRSSPVTAADLKNVIDWARDGQLTLSGICIRTLEAVESWVHHWATATTGTICLLDGSLLSDRPPGTWNALLPALDGFGLLVREDSLRRRPRRCAATLLPPSKRLRTEPGSSPSDSEMHLAGASQPVPDTVSSDVECGSESDLPSESDSAPETEPEPEQDGVGQDMSSRSPSGRDGSPQGRWFQYIAQPLSYLATNELGRRRILGRKQPRSF